MSDEKRIRSFKRPAANRTMLLFLYVPMICHRRILFGHAVDGIGRITSRPPDTAGRTDIVNTRLMHGKPNDFAAILPQKLVIFSDVATGCPFLEVSSGSPQRIAVAIYLPYLLRRS